MVITRRADLGGAHGYSQPSRITILESLTPPDTAAVLVHEFAHLCSAVAYVWLAGTDQSRRVKVRPIAARPFNNGAERQLETDDSRHWATFAE